MPLIIVLTVLSPATGLWFFKTMRSVNASGYVTSESGIYLANPSLAGGFFGAILFAILTILESSKEERSHVDAILYSVVSPLKVARVRIFAILTSSAIVQFLTMIVWLPYTIYKTGSLFKIESYCLMYLLFMFAEIVTGVLYASASYQLTRRADISFILYAVFTALGLTIFRMYWLLSWARPLVESISDDFSNNRILMSVAYMRLFWIVFLSGCCCITYLCIREYGKKARASFLYHLRHRCAFVCGLGFLIGGVVIFVKQPLLNHALPYTVDRNEVTIMEDVICDGMVAQIYPNTRTGTLTGKATYHFQNNSGMQKEITFKARSGYHFQYVKANGKDVAFKEKKDDYVSSYTLSIMLPKDKDIELSMEYGGFPREWSAFNDHQGSMEISKEYMFLMVDCSAPYPKNFSLDYENGTITLDITVPKNLTVVLCGTGNAVPIKENKETKTWRINSKGIILVGDYVCEEFEAGV